MVKRSGWRSVLLLIGAACSGEKITAPGACPEYCATTVIQTSDTVLTGAVLGDSSFRGYASAPSALQLQIAGGGAVRDSRAIIRFSRFKDTLALNGAADTAMRAVMQTDSFRIKLNMSARTQGVSGALVLYRVPRTVDSLTAYSDLDPYFTDSMRIASVPVPDIGSRDTLYVPFPASALPTFRDDSLYAAIGVALVSPTAPAFVSVWAVDAGYGAQLKRYVQVDSVTGVRVVRADSVFTAFDSFVFQPLPAPAAGALAVGGVPSAHAFLRLNIPKRIVDSSSVVRATLLLVPAEPVPGAPGDSVRIIPHSVVFDFGPKSPVVSAAADSSVLSGGRAPVGGLDTIRVDVTAIVRSWHGDTTHARTVVLTTTPEAGSIGEVRFWSSGNAALRPGIEVTYVRPLNYGGS